MDPVQWMEARQLWDWIQWRLPPDIWLECQQVLHDDDPPSPTNPELASGLAELLNPATTRNRRLVLLRRLLLIIRNGE